MLHFEKKVEVEEKLSYKPITRGYGFPDIVLEARLIAAFWLVEVLNILPSFLSSSNFYSKFWLFFGKLSEARSRLYQRQT